MISIARTLARRNGAGRKAGSQRVDAHPARRQFALDIGDDVHHLAVMLEEELVRDLDGADLWRPGRHRCGRDRAASDARRAPWDRRAVLLRAPRPRAAWRRAAACRRSGGWSPAVAHLAPEFPGLDPTTAKPPKSRKIEIRRGIDAAQRAIERKRRQRRTAPRSAATARPGRCRRRRCIPWRRAPCARIRPGWCSNAAALSGAGLDIRPACGRAAVERVDDRREALGWRA